METVDRRDGDAFAAPRAADLGEVRFGRVLAALAAGALAVALSGCARRPPWVAPELAWAYATGASVTPAVATSRAVACAACHRSDGLGSAGVPDLAGLPADYIVEQVHEFRSGDRTSAQAGRAATARMVQAAQAVSDRDLARTAAYFAALPRRPWVRVVQAAGAVPDGVAEADGAPGDPQARVVVHVRAAAIARGEALVRSGGHGGEACASCHSADLRGLGDAPSLAGRSPAYLSRALWDICTGARRGAVVAQMQGPAGALGPADIPDVAAYLATLTP